MLQIVSLKIQIGQYILVLEAGKDETLYTDILAVASFLESSEYSWGYIAESVKNGCLSLGRLGFKTNHCPWPKDKGIGGSPMINY